MPIYSYNCLDCGSSFELLVNFGREKEVKCPRCKGRNLKKNFTTFGIGGEKGSSSKSSLGGSCSTGTCPTCF